MLPQRILRMLEEHRGMLLTLVGLPASFMFDFALTIFVDLRRLLTSSVWSHETRVKQVQNAVRSRPQHRLMCSARPNWLSLSTSFFDKSNLHQVSLPLYDILELDLASMTVRVEPQVSVHQLFRFLSPLGLTMAITLEMRDATIGGLAMAVGMTTHSHKTGLFQETIMEYDLVLPNGELIKVTAENEHAKLFHCLPWSHGTLGFVVALKLKVIWAKPFVKLNYRSVRGHKELKTLLEDLTTGDEGPDFVEAIVFDQKQSVIVTGDYCDELERRSEVNRIGRWYKKPFYKHVETFLNKDGEEVVPLEDYLFRHNKSIFWVLEMLIPFCNDKWYLLLFGWMLPPKPAFMKITTTPAIRRLTLTRQVFQDIVLPLHTLEQQLEKVELLLGIWPLLIYPCRIFHNRPGQIRSPKEKNAKEEKEWSMYNDLGVYGVPRPIRERQNYDALGTMRKLEQFAREVGGFSFLYADLFMTKDEFEVMFNLSDYEEVRRRYGAEKAFPHLYDKVRPEIDVFELETITFENESTIKKNK